MSGHSKWSKVKHQKAVTDAVKGKLFTKAAQAISIAVREGGGVRDPDGNFKLRLAIEKARSVNMPKENIDRALQRAAGLGSEGIETILYEGYGPGGAALIIEAVTDNRQRAVSAVRNILENAGGTLGISKFLFEKTDASGYQPKIPMTISESDRIKLDALVEQLKELDDVQQVFTNI